MKTRSTQRSTIYRRRRPITMESMGAYSGLVLPMSLEKRAANPGAGFKAVSDKQVVSICIDCRIYGGNNRDCAVEETQERLV